jgi:Mor family transcriptional regulator
MNLDGQDFLNYVIQELRAACPALDECKAQEVKARLRALLGGDKYYVPKRDPQRMGQVHAAVYRAALTDITTEELTRQHGVSRRTMYRLLKRGPGSDGGA